LTAVKLDNVSIVFGPNHKDALKLVDQGKSRDEIGTLTGAVLGVANASLTIEQGEILVLMGLSGSGKSTLLRAVNALAPVIRGTVQVSSNGHFINPYDCQARELKHLRTHAVSMVFQQFGLLPWRTVADNVALGLEFAHVSKSDRAAIVDKQLALVNLSKWADRRVGQLSGGMQQRVGLARAFATGAPILLMDEPFSALDPLIRSRLQDELLDLQKQLKKTIIFVSHDLDEALRIGNRIAIMEEGRIIQCGSPENIIRNPATAYVADFVRDANPLKFLKAGDVLSPASGDPPPGPATVTSDARLVDVLQLMERQSGPLAVIDNDTFIGTISSDNVIRGLTSFRPVSRATDDEYESVNG
jgi:glycine betaine/proline transport system ATP-binding protein